jgi:hypothetical protein
MSRLILPFLLLIGVIVSPGIGQAQERCGVVAYQQMLQEKNPRMETQESFEIWMEKQLRTRGTQLMQVNKTNSTYTIPVVVHIIHNGEAIGTGTNISDAQIQSQIDVMNKDYNRLNTDAASTPPEFQPVAGSISIQFVLARQDPEGQATTGITRTKGTQTSWAITDNTALKSLDYWPAENYLNIWVTSLSGGFIGYAQLPVTNLLSGLDVTNDNRLTDGVVIHYQAFGTGAGFNLLSSYNLGRTVTHEVGHFLGLRHIWGDATCGDDFVSDTPAQTNSTSGCPTGTQASCDSRTGYFVHKMYQNYMDYSFDACMNLFTLGQVSRFNVVLANCPRRLSLLTSPGNNFPTVVATDLGIRTLISPGTSSCGTVITPTIEVRNYGLNKIDSATIRLTVDGAAFQTKTFFGLGLNPQDITNLQFNNLSFAVNSSHTVAFQILRTNGATDTGTGNNNQSVQVLVPSTTTLPLIEPFASTPAGWAIINPDAAITWQNQLAPDVNPTNRAMTINFHAYENQGELDWLITPSFTIGNQINSQVRFDVAYVPYPNQTPDGLLVYALPGCSNDLSQAVLLYNKSGSALATSTSSVNAFTPSSDAQWRKSEVVSLSSLSPNVTYQLAFIGKNGYGNNLYLDNVIITDKVVNDISLVTIVSPALVHCQSNVGVQFTVRNLSSSNLTSFQVSYSLNGGTTNVQTFPTNMAIGEEKTFTLNTAALTLGKNLFTLTLINPNQLPDSNPGDNALTFATYFDTSTDTAPLRKTYDSNLESAWVNAAPAGMIPWSATTTNYQQSMVYPAFTNVNAGQEAWVVSPVIDLSRNSRGSLLFDVSYAQRNTSVEHLRVVASDDCGLTYKTILFDHALTDLTNATSLGSWMPGSKSDWSRQFVSLDQLAGKKNIRLALIATNANGNNLYVDNLEVFMGDDANPPVTSADYQLYYSKKETNTDVAITFNLPEKKDVYLQIFTMTGQLVAENTLPQTLNQTYYFDLTGQSNGLYIFRIRIDDQFTATRVFVSH